MKKAMLLSAALFALFASCETPSGDAGGKDSTASTTTTTDTRSMSASAVDSSFIPVDSANKMIGSYLSSISSDSTNLKSIILNADALREYLTSDSGKNISSMKVMFAHTLPYINAGNKGVPCGYKSGDLTIILAGYDANGKYIYGPTKSVLDRGGPCPSFCPLNGQAASDILP